MQRAQPLGALALVAIASTACQSFVGDYESDLTVQVPIDSSHLCQLERDEFSFDVYLDKPGKQGGPEEAYGLFEYYEDANRPFIRHMDGLIADTENEIGASVTYLSGAAGVGKTFVLRSLEELDEGSQCALDLDELFVEKPGELPFDVTITPDLETLNGEIVFNELPTVDQFGEYSLEGLLASGDCFDEDDALVPIVFIDGIDEVHDETAHLILESIDEFVVDSRAEGKRAHFLVAGRPEGFAAWLADPDRNEKNNDFLTSFDLVPPLYETGGDLEFRAYGYWDFTRQLEGLESEDLYDEYLGNFLEAVSSHPFLTYTLGNLAFGNYVVEHTGSGEETGEEQLKVGIMDDILLRNADTHDRPGTDSQYNSAYRRALEEAAVRYADVNSRGVFTVRSDDTVDVPGDDGRSLGEVRVRTLLSRSGGAFLTEAATVTTRFRFDPFWFQAHLIERYNQRHFPGYEYRGCE